MIAREDVRQQEVTNLSMLLKKNFLKMKNKIIKIKILKLIFGKFKKIFFIGGGIFFKERAGYILASSK